MGKKIQTTINPNDASSGHRHIFSQQFRFNKQLLCAVGLWPYQSYKDKSVQMASLLILCSIVVAAQVRAMMEAWHRFDLFVECFTPLATAVVGFLKIFSGLFHTQEMKNIFDQIQRDWEAMRHSPQKINILDRYAEKGRHWTIFYFTLVYSIVFGWYIMAIWPKVMDAVAPLNYSRRKFDLFPVDFGVDPDYYFYPIIILLYVTVFHHLLITVATDTLYMVITQHVCAMFEILRYNLHNILQDDKSTNVILESNIYEDMHYHEIVSCIKQHKIIIKYIKSIEFTCEWKLLIIVGLSTLGLSFTGYKVVATGHDSTSVDTIRFACFSIAQVFHLFCNTLPGHWIIESSSIVSDAAYSCKWHMMSLRSRKLILFLIRASINPCKITAGKMYCVSMANFGAVSCTMFIGTVGFIMLCAWGCSTIWGSSSKIYHHYCQIPLLFPTPKEVLRTSMSYLAMLNSMQ